MLIAFEGVEVVQRIADYITADPVLLQNTTKFILGVGWDQTKWPGGEFPTAVSSPSYLLSASLLLCLNWVGEENRTT